MSQWKKDAQGKFVGSVGEGKNNVPTPMPAVASTETPNTDAAVRPDYDNLVQRVRSAITGEKPSAFSYLSAAEDSVEEASREWEETRQWAYPGVGDLDAEEELQRTYERLSLAKENLHRARLLAAQTPEGEQILRDQMSSWHTRSEQSETNADGALKYLVRAQEISDVLEEVRKQREVEAEFQRIVKEARQPLGGE